MQRRHVLAATAASLGVGIAGCLDQTDDEPYELETLAEGLAHPWGLAQLPDGSLLVTERDGDLRHLEPESGDLESVSGLPDIHVESQGGLLDVALDPAFEDEAWVYLTYAVANDDGESTTALGRGLFDPDDPRLQAFERLYTADPYVSGGQHYGSRVVFGPDEYLYVTVGDRGSKEFSADHPSQDRTNDLGTVLRLTRDGSSPPDNPFAGEEDANEAIFSYGHRNPQGVTVHPETGDLWISDHGEEDGDSIAILEAGGNYGWPIAHSGCRYGTDDPVGDGPGERGDVVDPVYHWPCGSGGFPPAGARFYDGEAFPDWNGDLLVGTLAGQYLGRFAVDGRDVSEVDPLLDGQNWRVRDVLVDAETGELLVAVDDGDAPIVRVRPAD